jgi:hypothetical protein
MLISGQQILIYLISWQWITYPYLIYLYTAHTGVLSTDMGINNIQLPQALKPLLGPMCILSVAKAMRALTLARGKPV